MKTLEQKQIALAEACGWKRGHSVQWTDGCAKHYDWGWTDAEGKPQKTKEPPNYFKSLDAVRELEEIVPYELKPVLIDKLKRFIMRYDEGVTDWDVYSANATQRADALGVTWGLWTLEECEK